MKLQAGLPLEFGPPKTFIRILKCPLGPLLVPGPWSYPHSPSLVVALTTCLKYSKTHHI